MRPRQTIHPITPPPIAPTFVRDFPGLTLEVVEIEVVEREVEVTVLDGTLRGRDDSVPLVC